MAENRDQVSVDRVIAAPPEKIFELLADPASHQKIDGSGTVREAKGDGPTRLSLGSTFGMSMKIGLPYSMVSTVVEFDENRCIAWQSKPPSSFGARFGGGRIWRYSSNQTVAPGCWTWDISQESSRPRSGRRPEDRQVDGADPRAHRPLQFTGGSPG
jgi:hypothetical protein